MTKSLHLLFALFFSSQILLAQTKTPIIPIPNTINAENIRVGCSLFNDPLNYTTGSSFSFIAPTNNNSNLGVGSGTNLGCMGSVPNQTWFLITVTTAGNLTFNFSNSSNFDVDAVVWGPLSGNNNSNACASTQNAPLTCDYDIGRPDLYIANAQVGQKYVMLVTNYSNSNTTINVSQPTGGSVSYSMINLPNCSQIPTANISGSNTTISEGQSVNLTLSFTGSSPWNYRLSDGTIGTSYTSPINVNVFPTASQTYTINSVSNLCSTNSGTGSVGISVTRNVQLKTCISLDNNAQDSQNLNNGTLQNGVVISTNRLSEPNKAFQFDGVDDYISLTSNQLNNNTFSFATWVKLDELPNVNNPERIALSIGSSNDEHFLGVEFYNGNPAWVFSSNSNKLYSNAVVDLGWHLIIGIRSGGQLKLYIDGILTGTQNISGFASYGANLSTRIGSSIQNTKFFKGKIDDVKFFNSSLIEPEVLLLQNYNSCNNVFNDTYISVQSVSTSVICTGSSFILRAFTNNILPDGQLQFIAELSNINGSFSNPTTIGSSSFLPLNVSIPNNISNGAYKVRIRYGGLISINSFDIFVNNPANYNINGTVAINEGQSSNLTLNFTGTGPWSYVMSNGLSGLATTTPWIIPISPDQTTTYSISSTQNICGTATINGNSSATVTVNYSKEFISCLPFNSNALDSKNNNTTVVNGPILTENRYGQTNAAYNFTGSGNYIEYTTNSLRKREYTMSAWVMANLISGSNQYILSQGEIGANTFQGLGVNSSGWFFQSYTSNGLSSIANSTSLSTNQWVHLTAVRTYQSLKLYINGNLVSTTSNSSIIPFKTSDIGRIGANSSTLGNYFNGKIDDVRLYKGALTDDEVFALFANITDCPEVQNAPIIVVRSVSPTTVCEGNTVSVSYTSTNVGISAGSPLNVLLSDQSGSFSSPTIIGSGSSSPITATIPIGIPNSAFYRIRLVSTSGTPVNSANTRTINVSGSLPTASLSGGGSIQFGQNATLTLNFTGTAPWTFALNDGSSQTTSSNPFSISISPFATTNYTISSLSNSCGNGPGTGSATITVSSVIIINSSTLSVCKNQSFNLAFSSNILNSSLFEVEISDQMGLFSNPVSLGNGQIGSINCSIPTNVTLGNYKLRIKNGSIISNLIDLEIKSEPISTISGSYEVEDGTDITIPINFTGVGPYNFTLSNGYSSTSTSNLFNYNYLKPKIDQNLTVQNISNSCGTGYSFGNAIIDVKYTKKLISCFNLDNNANDQKGFNNGVIHGAIPTIDRFGNPNSAMQFDGINDYIQFPANNLENQVYTYSAWVMLFSLPFANASEETNYRTIVGVSNSQYYHSLFSYYYHYDGYAAWRVNSTRAYYKTPNSNLPLVNQWYHLTMVSDENSLKLYVNGSFVGISDYSSDDPINYYINPIGTTGAKASTNGLISRFFHGKIDDVRIFRGALNDSEVSTLYNSTQCSDIILVPKITLNNLNINSLCRNTAFSVGFVIDNIEVNQTFKVQMSDLNGSFDSPLEIGLGNSSPISATIPANQATGTGYKIRLVSSDAVPVVSNLSANLTINAPVTATISGTAVINEGETANLTLNFSGTAPYTYMITGGTSQSTSLSSVSIPVSPLTNTTYQITSLENICGTSTGTGSAIITVNPVPIRLVSCFPFNGNANDSKGLNNGTVFGATLTTDRFGNVISAYSFDGNDRIFLEINSMINDEYSYGVWINIQNVNSIAHIFTITDPNGNIYPMLSTNDANRILFSNHYANNNILVTNNTIQFNQWYHITLVKTLFAFKLYLNGQFIQETLNQSGFGAIPSNGEATIGGLRASTYGAFNGKIDDVQIYKGALTAGQVQALFQNTNPCFDATTYNCLSDNLFTTMLSGQQTLQVSNQIIGRSSIQTNAVIHFDSKNSIILEPGFKTEPNTVFKATVGGGCN